MARLGFIVSCEKEREIIWGMAAKYFDEWYRLHCAEGGEIIDPGDECLVYEYAKQRRAFLRRGVFSRFLHWVKDNKEKNIHSKAMSECPLTLKEHARRSAERAEQMRRKRRRMKGVEDTDLPSLLIGMGIGVLAVALFNWTRQ